MRWHKYADFPEVVALNSQRGLKSLTGMPLGPGSPVFPLRPCGRQKYIDLDEWVKKQQQVWLGRHAASN